MRLGPASTLCYHQFVFFALYRYQFICLKLRNSATVQSLSSYYLSTEVKQLKQLVRNIIDPSRDLGHVDRHKDTAPPAGPDTQSQTASVVPRAAELAGAPSSNRTSPNQNGRESTQTDEKTIPTDPEAAVAIGPLEEDVEKGRGKGEDQGQNKTCEDCA